MVSRARPRFAALAALVVAALSVAGCVSMPTGGPVLSYPVTQGTAAQNQSYVQIVPQPPGADWSPAEIVQGFLTASASFGSHSDVALEYLTPQEAKAWDPSWSAIVYKVGPNVRQTTVSRAAAPPAASPSATASSTAKAPAVQETATVVVTGQEQAYLRGYGSYSVPSASGTGASLAARRTFSLVEKAGQWRIASAPQELLLTSDSFQYDYQQRNLYFFNPTGPYLVPDPVYVPLQAQPIDLMNGLVHDLITPPVDWLSGGATTSALPSGTKIAGVTLEGVATAVVNLTGTAISKAGNQVMEEVSSQLLRTLSGTVLSSGQAVQSVEVEQNGKPWFPPGSPENPVQNESKFSAAAGATPVFYYVDSAGYLNSRNGLRGKPARLGAVGTGYQQIAVSPDGRYLAALHGSTLYTGTVGGALARKGSGYASISWDVNDDLWASAGAQIVVFRGAASTRQALGQRVTVSVASLDGAPIPSGSFTSLRVAPDGVRVAIVIGGDVLVFGAISGEQGATPRITLSQVQMSPVDAATFTGLTWYGADDVIALADPGPVATMYPVSGGTSTSIPVDPEMRSVTASSGEPLIAGLPGGQLKADASLTGSWMVLGSGSAPAYPG